MWGRNRLATVPGHSRVGRAFETHYISLDPWQWETKVRLAPGHRKQSRAAFLSKRTLLAPFVSGRRGAREEKKSVRRFDWQI